MKKSEHTMKELKVIYDDYVAAGGFVGLMSFSTPMNVQRYVYRGMRSHLYLNFFEDIKILIERRSHVLLRPYLVFYKTLRDIEHYLTWGRVKDKEKKKQERVRKQMLDAGCYVGSGDYYHTRGKK